MPLMLIMFILERHTNTIILPFLKGERRGFKKQDKILHKISNPRENLQTKNCRQTDWNFSFFSSVTNIVIAVQDSPYFFLNSSISFLACFDPSNKITPHPNTETSTLRLAYAKGSIWRNENVNGFKLYCWNYLLPGILKSHMGDLQRPFCCCYLTQQVIVSKCKTMYA